MYPKKLKTILREFDGYVIKHIPWNEYRGMQSTYLCYDGDMATPIVCFVVEPNFDCIFLTKEEAEKELNRYIEFADEEERENSRFEIVKVHYKDDIITVI